MSLSNLELYLRVLKAKIVKTTQKLHYQIAVPKDKHQAAVKKAETFAGDFMAYLNEPRVWDKLDLESSQNRALNGLSEIAKGRNLYNQGAGGKYDGFQVLKLGFGNYDNVNNFLVGDYLKHGKYLNFAVCYNVDKDLPVSAWFGGVTCDGSGIGSIDDVNFLFSPNPIITENISNIVTKSMLTNTKVTTTANRVLLEYNNIKCAYQYHLLGQMEWSLAPELLVYAHNSRKTIFTRPRELPEGELSYNTVFSTP